MKLCCHIRVPLEDILYPTIMYINTPQKGDVCVQRKVPAKCFKKYKKTHELLRFFFCFISCNFTFFHNQYVNTKKLHEFSCMKYRKLKHLLEHFVKCRNLISEKCRQIGDEDHQTSKQQYKKSQKENMLGVILIHQFGEQT